MPIRVLVADDHEPFRESLGNLLESASGITVAGEAGTLAAAIQLTRACQPDVVLLDVHMPDGSGLDAIAEILQCAPHTTVFMLTMHGDHRYVRRAFEAGARGYILKDSTSDVLCNAIRRAVDGT